MIGRALYGAAFCVLLPLALAWWAVRLEPVVGLPAWRSSPVGAALGGLGVVLVLGGWWALWRRGGGLPMNAFPPRRRVTTGVFALLSHPVYVGAACMGAGLSIWIGSAAGLWMVTPVLALGCAALVLGYERDATRARLGEPTGRPWLSLAQAGEGHASRRERAGALIIVFLPWLVVYEFVGHIPVPRPWSGWIGGEQDLPVWTWTEPLYASVYLMAPAACLACRTRDDLRNFAFTAWIATLGGALLYVALPVTTPPRAFDSGALFATLHAWERADGLAGRAALPSFHVFWSLMAARTFAARFPRWRWAAWAWGVAALTSCWTTGMHSVLDVGAGVAFSVGVFHWRRWWAGALRAGERVANSWREWRFGPVRVISHAFYAGIAALVGIVVASSIAPHALGVFAVTGASALLGAAVVGQLLVGRAGSLRPFGYYGSVLGAGVALAVAGAAGWADWRAAAAPCAAAPWVQAIGRLRCLVQGCCHGRACEEGITYRHERSRVVRLTGLSGRPVHPTPLYSIAGNIILGVVLARMCRDGAAAPIVVGMYAIGAGLLRFIEEHYRGEPHTPVRAGLRLYQWLAMASVGVGIAVSGMFTGPATAIVLPPGEAWAWALGVGAIYFFAMGVDFPESQRRFARLA